MSVPTVEPGSANVLRQKHAHSRCVGATSRMLVRMSCAEQDGEAVGTDKVKRRGAPEPPVSRPWREGALLV